MGLEYDICAPEFEYLCEFLLSDRGMGIKPDSLQNRPRDGRMWLDLPNGARFEAKSWDRKDTLKGKEIDCYLYCLPLDAPVWMGDYSFRPIRDVKVGDEVIGATPGRGYRGRKERDRLCRATVTQIHRKRDLVVRVTLESGRILYCTPDHRWLSGANHGANGNYIVPKVGASLVSVVDDPGPAIDPVLNAWLAGMYDGEGSRTMIAQDREYNASLHHELQRRLERAGFATTSTPDGVRWLGGMQGALKFVNQVPSIRFREKYADDAILIARYRHADKIVSIDEAGEQEVACITTTTGNFVAYGAMSHNCEAYMLPGLECYTDYSQNLRARNGYAVFATTPDRPWLKDIYDAATSGDPKFAAWHVTSGVSAEVNPFTFDQGAKDRHRPSQLAWCRGRP